MPFGANKRLRPTGGQKHKNKKCAVFPPLGRKKTGGSWSWSWSFLLGPAQTGCPPAARAGGLTSLGWAQEAALECPRRKTADRNIPLRALLWASALTRRGHCPSLTRGALIHLSEACIGPVLSVCVCFWLKLGSSLGSSCLRAASRTEQDRTGQGRAGQDKHTCIHLISSRLIGGT